MSSSQSKLGKLGIGTADPVDTFLRHVEFQPGITREQRVMRGTAGTFFTDSNLVRESRQLVLPTGTHEPTASELMYLLAWMFGAGVGSNPTVFTPDGVSNSPLRYLHWFPVNGDPYFVGSVGLDNFSLSAQVGEPVTFTWEGVGISHDTTHGSFPAISPDVTTYPFMLADLTASGGAFTFSGSTRQPAGFTYRQQNFVDRNRFLDSLTLTRVQGEDQHYGFQFAVPSGDNAALWVAGVSSPVSLLATFKNVNTGAILSISSSGIMFPPQSPRHVPGQEGMLAIEGTGYRTGGTVAPVSISLRTS